MEYVNNVIGNPGVAGKQYQVGVETGRLAVIITSGDVRVATQTVVILAYDQCRLAVGLETDDAVDDMDACLFQGVRHGQVLLLIEASREFDQAGYLFT